MRQDSPSLQRGITQRSVELQGLTGPGTYDANAEKIKSKAPTFS